MAAIKEITERINLQAENQDEEVQEISLDSIQFEKFTAEINKALEKFKDSLLILSLNGCNISSLDNFPDLPNLIRIELNDNKLTGSELEKLTKLEELQAILLGKNQIAEYSDLKALSKLGGLVQLELAGCAISEKADYREKVFETFEGLEILDDKDQEGNDVDLEDEDGDGEGDHDGEDDEDEEEFNEDEDDEDEEEEEEPKPKKKGKKN